MTDCKALELGEALLGSSLMKGKLANKHRATLIGLREAIVEVEPPEKVLKTIIDKTSKGKPVFSALPSYEEGQKNMVYAGIGTRKLPPDVAKELEGVARELQGKGYTLRSGGADGADVAFERGAGSAKEIYLPNTDYVNKSTGEYFQKERAEAGLRDESRDIVLVDNWPKGGRRYVNGGVHEKTVAIAREIHPSPEMLIKRPGVEKLMARNTLQVFGEDLSKPVDFVLFYAEEGDNPLRPNGGTGQAVEMARRKGVPTINMAEKGWREKLDAVLNGEAKPAVMPVEESKKEIKEDYSSELKSINEDISSIEKKISKLRKENYSVAKLIASYGGLSLTGLGLDKSDFRGKYRFKIDGVNRQTFYTIEGKGGTVDGLRPMLSREMPELGDMTENDVAEFLLENLDRFVDSDVNAEYENLQSLLTQLDNQARALQEGSNLEVEMTQQSTTYGSAFGDLVSNMDNAENMSLDLVNNPEKISELAASVHEVDVANGKPSRDAKFLLGLVSSITNHLGVINPTIITSINRSGVLNEGKITKVGEASTFLQMALGPNGGNITGLEMYAEELVHALTALGLDFNDIKVASITSAIGDIRENFFKNVTAEMLAEKMPDQGTAMRDAKELLEYFSRKDVGLAEFMAKGITNPYVMDVLRGLQAEKPLYEGETLAAKFVRVMQKVFRLVTAMARNEPKGNELDRLLGFVVQLGDANVKAIQNKNKGIIAKVSEIVENSFEKRARKVVESAIGKAQEFKLPKLPLDASVFDTVVYYAKLVPISLVNDKARDIMKVHLSRIGAEPWGTVQMISKDMSDQKDYYSEMQEAIGMGKHDSDRVIAMTELMIKKELKEGFPNELSETEKRGLSQLMRIDVGALDMLREKGLDTRELFNPDGKELEARIAEIEAELKDKYGEKDRRYYSKMSELLGRHLVTGETNVVMLENAYNIAHKVNFGKGFREAPEGLEEVIDALASLYAVKAVEPHMRAATYDLMGEKKYEVGVASIGKFLKDNRENVNRLYKDTPFMKTKGQLVDVFPDGQEYVIRPMAQKEQLEKEGYKLQKELETEGYAYGRPVPFGVFVSNDLVRGRLHSSGFKYNNMSHRGPTIRDHYLMTDGDVSGQMAALDISKVQLKTSKIMKEIVNGTYVEKVTDKGMAPIVNSDGRVIDFSYELSQDEKRKHLRSNMDPIEQMAMTSRRTVDKMETVRNNKNQTALITKIMKEYAKDQDLIKLRGGRAISKRDGKSYILINGDSTNEEFRQLWYSLPPEVRDEFKGEMDSQGNVMKPAGMYLREDHVREVLGFREFSLADTRLMKKMSPKLRHAVRVAEAVWKNVVAISKVAIIIKMPFVLINNIISNFFISLAYLENPIEVMKLQMQGVEEVNKYVKLHKKEIDLQIKVNAGVASENDVRELARTREMMKNSPMKPLIDAGFYTQILEETELQQHRAQMVERWADNKMEKMPRLVKMGVNYLFLTDKSAPHKFMYTATQYSDLTARYAQYHLMKRKGHSEQAIMKTLRNAFINYNKPNSPLMEWANQVGLVMFTKYYIRIQRFIVSFGKENPFKTILALGIDGYLGDPATANDSFLLTAGLPGVNNPLDIVERAITPGAFIAADNVLGSSY